jgi:hypothetical protein
MAITITPINLGTVPGDQTGSTARTGGGYINDNFAAVKAAGDLVLDVPQDSILGRITASTGDVEQLTAAQVKTILGYGELDQNESVTGLWNFQDVGTGALTGYDLTIGDVTTPDYGITRIGNSVFGRTSHITGYNLDGTFIIQNVGGPITGDIEFAVIDASNLLRFALPKSGVGNATYNPRSMLIAGPAVADSDIVTVTHWQGQGIFHNLTCDTATNGADLGVQNDLEVEGQIWVDIITESTIAAGVTIEGVLLKDSEVAWSYIGTTPTTLSGYGISDTKANFNTALSDGTFMFTGDAPTAHTHEGTAILSGGPVTDGYVLTADGVGGSAWEEASGGSGAFTADATTAITPTTPIVLDEATGDEAALTLNYTTNKLTSGNDTGLVINQTDTASPGTSLLADFQVGGVSKARVAGDGVIHTPSIRGPDGLTVNDGIDVVSGGISIIRNEGVSFYFTGESTKVFKMVNNAEIEWSDSVTTAQSTAVLRLAFDANDTLAQRRSTNPQTFNLYNTYTDASNYERGFLKWNLGVFEIGTEAAGTGTARNMKLLPAGGQVILPLENDEAAPTLAFGDGDTGFFESADDFINVSLAGLTRFSFTGGTFFADNASGPQIADIAASGTTPTIRPSRNDSNTGLGRAAADQLSLIAGGVEVLRVTEDTGNAIQLTTGQTVAGLPTTPAVGMIARVTDASSPTVGSTVTGGGADAALVWYDGANWVVTGGDAPAGGGITWVVKTGNYTAVAGDGVIANISSGTITLPLTLTVGDHIEISNIHSSVLTVADNGNTIRHNGVSYTDNITMVRGETMRLVAVTTGIWEII